jgi:hypothetical protein
MSGLIKQRYLTSWSTVTHFSNSRPKAALPAFRADNSASSFSRACSRVLFATFKREADRNISGDRHGLAALDWDWACVDDRQRSFLLKKMGADNGSQQGMIHPNFLKRRLAGHVDSAHQHIRR